MEQSHFSALQLKHAGLERQLADELSRPVPDLSTIQLLKKRKLRIKEELAHHSAPTWRAPPRWRGRCLDRNNGDPHGSRRSLGPRFAIGKVHDSSQRRIGSPADPDQPS